MSGERGELFSYFHILYESAEFEWYVNNAMKYAEKYFTRDMHLKVNMQREENVLARYAYLDDDWFVKDEIKVRPAINKCTNTIERKRLRIKTFCKTSFI